MTSAQNQSYKVVTFQTEKSSSAAYCALVAYRDHIVRALKNVDPQRGHGVDYWNSRLVCIDLAIADYDAGVMQGDLKMYEQKYMAKNIDGAAS